MLVLSPDISPHPCVTNNFVTNMRFTDRQTCSLLLLDNQTRVNRQGQARNSDLELWMHDVDPIA